MINGHPWAENQRLLRSVTAREALVELSGLAVTRRWHTAYTVTAIYAQVLLIADISGTNVGSLPQWEENLITIFMN